MPDREQKDMWERLAWIEIDACQDDLARRVPSLERFSVDLHAILGVSSFKTGLRPFGIKWSRSEPGRFDRISLPYYILKSSFARKQVAWLLAGFLHAARRYAHGGPRKWKRISRAGGIVGLLIPRFRQALAVSRLEPLAMVILAAGGRLSWARLKVPGISHLIFRVRHKDIEDAHWLGKQKAVAKEQVRARSPRGDAILRMALDQAALECARLSVLLGGSDHAREAGGAARALARYASLFGEGAGQARKKSKSNGRKKASDKIRPSSGFERSVLARVRDRKVDNGGATSVLAEVDDFETHLLEHVAVHDEDAIHEETGMKIGKEDRRKNGRRDRSLSSGHGKGL